MVVVWMSNCAVDTISSRGAASIVGGADPNAREVTVAAFGAILAAKNSQPIDCTVFMSVKTKLGQVIEVFCVGGHIERAKQGTLFFPEP